MDNASRFTISDKVTWKDLGESVIVLNLVSSEYYTLNETASVIWRGLTQAKSVLEIRSMLEDAFEADTKEIAAALSENLDEWKSNGVISLSA